MTTLTERVDFSLIRYSNCWEDADVLLKALPGNAARILCIASAGDNALALLAANPQKVHAVDVSLPQIWLTKLKQQCFAQLEYEEMLQFLGVMPCSEEQRSAYLSRLLPSLSLGAQDYWKSHHAVLLRGILHGGKFERYFHLFRTRFLPLVHSRANIEKLLSPRSDAEQKDFYLRKWDTWRWRLLMRLFFSRFVLGHYGRDPQFLKHVQVPVAHFIRQKTEAHLQSSDATQNPFLRYILTGQFGAHLPFYLRRENFDSIRRNIFRLSLEHCDATHAVKAAGYDTYCMSNIFEYQSQEEFYTLVSQWSQGISIGSRLLFWNLMAPRRFSDASPVTFKKLDKLANAAAAHDKGFFYAGFYADEKL